MNEASDEISVKVIEILQCCVLAIQKIEGSFSNTNFYVRDKMILAQEHLIEIDTLQHIKDLEEQMPDEGSYL